MVVQGPYYWGSNLSSVIVFFEDSQFGLSGASLAYRSLVCSLTDLP